MAKEPLFYTGHSGKEHERLSKVGKDFLCIELHRGVWLVTPMPQDHDLILREIEWGSWVCVRAETMDLALAAAPYALEQYENEKERT